MATKPLPQEETDLPESTVEDLKRLLWGTDIAYDVFKRWTQGFVYSTKETSALVQLEGGPCAVLAPLQGFIFKNLLFNPATRENWQNISEGSMDAILCTSMAEILEQAASTSTYTLLYLKPSNVSRENGPDEVEEDRETSSSHEGTSPKKRRFSHEQFHSCLRCQHIHSREELRQTLYDRLSEYQAKYGVLLYLYSLILTKGLEQIKNEVEDPGESLIDGTYGHGSQSLINMLITGKATSNVWDGDKEVSGLKLKGIDRQSTIGFLTVLEHLRYCEVGWYLKNPEYPVWVVASETHLTLLFSLEKNLVVQETPDAMARRVFCSLDPDGNGFISSTLLGDLMQATDLVSEPEYVALMRTKLDPEELGIITLASFLEEFFPEDPSQKPPMVFDLYHYNGLHRPSQSEKVEYRKARAVIEEMPDIQIITDSSHIRTVLMTKWPTIELTWKDGSIPSLN